MIISNNNDDDDDELVAFEDILRRESNILEHLSSLIFI